MKKMKVTFEFPTDTIKHPLMYHLIKDYDLLVNILNADISLNRIGRLVADLSGDEQKLKEALQFVEKQGVRYKIFDKRIIWNEEECIHCGACTSVCPSDALNIDSKTGKLLFDQEKCLVCELCIKACPLNVMNVQE